VLDGSNKQPRLSFRRHPYACTPCCSCNQDEQSSAANVLICYAPPLYKEVARCNSERLHGDHILEIHMLKCSEQSAKLTAYAPGAVARMSLGSRSEQVLQILPVTSPSRIHSKREKDVGCIRRPFEGQVLVNLVLTLKRSLPKACRRKKSPSGTVKTPQLCNNVTLQMLFQLTLAPQSSSFRLFVHVRQRRKM
jgi:hypothetical protein